MQQVFKASDIAKVFNVTLATVGNWIKKGELNAYETLGGHYRIMREDLFSFIEKKNFPLPDELKSPEELKAGKYRILIVDDEKNVIEAVQLMLEDIGVDTEIRTAINGVTAGLELIDFKPHLVILDVSMPGADGDVVIKALKKKESLKDVRILIFTGYPNRGRKLFKLGADKLIEKGSKESDVENFQKEVCKLLDVKYRKVIIKNLSLNKG